MSERGRIFMVKKVLACLLLVVLWCSCAWAVVGVDKDHYSIATLRDGKPDYSEARFNYMEFCVGDTGITASADNMNLSGTLTFSGGNYSFWNGKEMQKVSGTQQTFKLGVPSWTSIADEIEFYPLTDTGSTLRFGIEADGGFNAVTTNWNFPDITSLDGSLTLPNFLTTAQQLENHVLYFEFKRSGENVTGINWRVVKASDPSTALTLDFPSEFLRFRAWNFDGTRILNLKPGFHINPGETAEGTLDFDTPIKESEIWYVRTEFYTYDEEENKCYLWDYYTPTDPVKPHIWSSHASEASLVNGKSDYSSARFSDLFIDIEADDILSEIKHFTNAGSMTIQGGEYSVTDSETKTASAVPAGSNMTFALRNHPAAVIGDTYLEYRPINDSGNSVYFTGSADTSLNGKTVSWTFPAELNFDGSGVIPNYKSTAQQLATAVPYVEVISKDGYITAVNYKIVTASDTSTAITPNYRTDFGFRIYRTDKLLDIGNSYNVGTASNKSSGTYTLDIPQLLSTMKRLRVRLTRYENPDNPAVYQWNFYLADAPSSLEITTATLPDATQNASYTATLAANLTGATWSVISGSLPAGLTLNTSTGAITGTPTTAGTSRFTVRAVKDSKSAEKQLSITVSPIPTITITTESLPSGTVNTSYSATLTSSTAGATWTVSSGNLPSGLTLSTSGAISGTPTRTGSYTFTIRAVYGTASDEKQFTVTISAPTLTITTTSLPDGTTGTAYTATLAADDSPVTWSISSGTLPDGLTLNTSTGAITGTPTIADKYTFTVRAVSGSQSAEKSLSITVNQNETTGIDNNRNSGCETGLAVSALFLLAMFLKRR